MRYPVYIQNPAPVPRQGSWCAVNVPEHLLAAGDMKVEERPDTKLVWGPPTPQGRMLYLKPWRLEAGELVKWHVQVTPPVPGDEPPPPDGREQFLVPIEGDEASLPFGKLELRLGTEAVEYDISSFVVLEVSPAAVSYHHSGRIPGTLWVVDLWVSIPAGSLAPRFELKLTAQHPLDPKQIEQWDEVILDIAGVSVFVLAIDELLAKGGAYVTPQRVVLSRDWWIADSQTLTFFGRHVLPTEDVNTGQAEVHGPLVGMVGAEGWEGHMGPWGAVPKAHPALRQREAFKREYDAWAARYNVAGTHYRNDLLIGGLNDVPSGTGYQPDFGVTKLLRAFLGGGNPIWLLMAQATIAREVGRPQMFHEPDGSPLDGAKHPKLVTWGFYPHYSERVSPDQLKPVTRSPHTQELWTMAFSHASINLLAGWTILTGSHLGRHVLEQLLTLALKATPSLGEERAWGRTPLVVAWIWHATKDPRCLEFARKVIESPMWDAMLRDAQAGKDVCVSHVHYDWFADDGAKRPWHDHSKPLPYWQPWQQGLEIAGLDALARCFPDVDWATRANAVLDVLCKTHVLHAWSFWQGRWTVGKWHVYLDGGKALPEDHYDVRPVYGDPHWDPDDPHKSTAFDRWSLAAVRIAARRTDDADVQKKAQDIDRAMTSAWAMADPGLHIDDFEEWAAVR